MSLLDIFRPAKTPQPQVQVNTPVNVPSRPKPNFIKRAFNSVFSQSLTSLFGSPSIQQDLRHLKTVRDQARTLSLNSPVIRRYLEIMKASTIGASGISVQCQAVNPDGSSDFFNPTITDLFEQFSEDVTVTGGINRTQLESMAVEYLCRDGEFLALIHRGEGDHNIKVSVLEPDHLDENYNDYFYATNNRVVGGVEIDQYGKPVAYHLWRYNPSDALMGVNQERIRYEAKDVIHIFDRERISQTRGYSWTAPCIEECQNLIDYRKYVLVQAKHAASNAIYFEQAADNADPFADSADDVDDEGHVTLGFSPETIEVMPKGWKVSTVNFSNSNQTSLDAFQKSLLRVIAAGLGVSYHALACDYESVNFSASKAAAMVDEVFFKTVQKLVSEQLTKRLYNEWLAVNIMVNSWGLNIPMTKFQKFKKIRLTPPAYKSVDAIKESQNDLQEYQLGVASISELCERRGKNLEDILRQRQADKKLMEQYGVTDITATGVVSDVKKAV